MVEASTKAGVYIQKKIKVQTEEAKAGAPEKKEEPEPEDEDLLAAIMKDLTLHSASFKPTAFETIQFEKDDDTNFHIDFIHACANLRARNYVIEECTHHKTKMIAGKIIPAVATATAMITGCVTAEILKYAQGWTDIEKFKNGFVNLAINYFCFTEPNSAKLTKSVEYDPVMCGPIKAIPEGFSVFDKVIIKRGSLTFQQLFDEIQALHNVEVSMVSCGRIALYNAYMPGGKHKVRLPMKPEELYVEISKDEFPPKRNYMVLELGGETEDGEDFSMPPVQYYFR